MVVSLDDIKTDLKGKALRGGFAKIASQATNFALRIGSLVVLARLLDPKDFGLVAMVTAFTGVFNLLKDFGLSSAAVQRDRITDEQMSMLFWINMMVGVTLAVLLAAIAPLIASFYHEPQLFWVAVALGADFIFTGASAQHSAILQRQMRFTTLAGIEIGALLAGVSIAITMAVGGFGFWALVGQAVAVPAVTAMSLWAKVRWIPGLPRRRTEIGSMVRFGGTVTLNGLVVYIAYNIEKVLLGRFWGAAALGLYGRAYQLISIPTENLNYSIGGIAFSALSRLQDDRERLKSYFLKGYSLILALTMPITIACGVFADDLIIVLLGPKWMDVVPIFRLLVPTILVFGLINPLAWLLFSLGLVGRSLKIALVIAPLTISAYVIGLPYGPNGVALAYSAAMILWTIPHILWCISGTGVSNADIYRAAARPFLSALAAALVSIGAQTLLAQNLNHLLRLILGGGVLLCFYIWMLLYVMGQKGFYLDLIRNIKKRAPTEYSESRVS
jgi:PST family polysaccharide transporter